MGHDLRQLWKIERERRNKAQHPAEFEPAPT